MSSKTSFVCLFALVFWLNQSCLAQNLPDDASRYAPADRRSAPGYSFTEAVNNGVVELFANRWAAIDPSPMIERLQELSPGLVNRVGFQFAGFKMANLEYAQKLALLIHSVVPQARVGGGFPESLKLDYEETLPDDDGGSPQHFQTADLGTRASGKYIWIDPALSRAQDFYICIGKLQISRGFNHLHFEECDNVIKNSMEKEAAIRGYRHVQEELAAYGRKHGVDVSFSGEPELAQRIPLDSVYLPSRFYIDSFATEYRNRIPQPGIGVGYTYALSNKIIMDSMAKVPARTKVFFYIDNFDYKQDDLRRMMELDAQNRRTLILRSSKNAHNLGAVFIPNLNHADGCVPASLVGDLNEIVNLKSGQSISEYNALSCGDWLTVKRALQIQRGARP